MRACAADRAALAKMCDPRIRADSTLLDVCYAVCTTLERDGVTAVLTGGSAATFYAPEAYQSRDADFIVMKRPRIISSPSAMETLGYNERSGIYIHETNAFTVEFPPGPLAIGGDLVSAWETFERHDEQLHVLNRTDCVRDRLAGFYFYADRSSLRSAVAVARSGAIDIDCIRTWSERERELARFEDFLEELRRD